jgi:hypothetical protein
MSDAAAKNPCGSEAEADPSCTREVISDDVEKALGGSGGPSALTTRDVRLVALALAERWEMDPTARAAMIHRLEDVVANPTTKLRAFFTAVRAITSLSRLNLAAVDTAIRAKQADELVDRVTELEKRLEAPASAKGGWR